MLPEENATAGTAPMARSSASRTAAACRWGPIEDARSVTLARTRGGSQELGMSWVSIVDRKLAPSGYGTLVVACTKSTGLRYSAAADVSCMVLI
jgi:hypothetical protein